MENKEIGNSEMGVETPISSDTEALEALLKTMSPEKLMSLIQELERQKREKLEKELKDIEEQIAALNSKAAKIREELGISKNIKRGRSGDNAQFTLDGMPMSASAIARQFNLETYGINWRIKLLSILSGNSGGLPESVASEIRRRVKYIGSY